MILRISTSRRVFDRPLSKSEAEAAVSAGFAQPVAGILDPGERHRDILRTLAREGTTGPLVMDAVLAAIALEHGATICTTDRDFARFPRLKWTDPIVGNG